MWIEKMLDKIINISHVKTILVIILIDAQLTS